uniref:ferredoxin:thioredoxin reductase n=1 Tax=Eustigmatophyceae sp. Ndem 8/9T-3m6.8 TaxID=2506146 RepID=A0A3R5V085_9STRA|nr:plastid ferredoxin-thioredoxin reductase beta subunit [Eustigmatophyceae sp. Ndem 8/9T-3m6.8]
MLAWRGAGVVLLLCSWAFATQAFLGAFQNNRLPSPPSHTWRSQWRLGQQSSRPQGGMRWQTSLGAKEGDADVELSVSMKAMQKFAEKYCEITDTYFCSDLEVTATVIKGLAMHKDELGAPLCPCRHYEDKPAEVNLAYWNCPCVPMRERKECHCMLFLTKDNPFVGDKQAVPDSLLVDPKHVS